MNNNQYGLIVTILAVIGGLVVLGWVLRIAFGLIPLIILVAIGVFLYVFLQKNMGRGR